MLNCMVVHVCRLLASSDHGHEVGATYILNGILKTLVEAFPAGEFVRSFAQTCALRTAFIYRPIYTNEVSIDMSSLVEVPFPEQPPRSLSPLSSWERKYVSLL